MSDSNGKKYRDKKSLDISNKNILSYMERVPKEYASHVNMIAPNKGTYNISYKNIDIFWDKYSADIMLQSKVNEYIYGIAEKPQQYMPVIVDIDLKTLAYDSEGNILYKEGDNLYTLEQVKILIKIYQAVLKGLIRDIKQDDLDCIFLSKNSKYRKYAENIYIKHGFHLHFPKIFLNKDDQKVFLLSRVKMLIENKCKDLFKNIGIENASKIIDEGIYNLYIMLYGSKKEPEMEPYIVDKIFNYNQEEITLRKSLENYPIFYQNGKRILFENDITFYLPRILSIIPGNREIYNISIDHQLRIVRNPKPQKKRREYDEIEFNEAVSQIRDLIKLLDPERADIYLEWMHVGWAIFNITEGEDIGLELWKEFSQLSEKYCEDRCNYEWDNMEKKNITIGTLKYWASKDNPKEYTAFIKKSASDYIKEKLRGNDFHGEMSKILHNLYGSQFICASIINKNTSWYYYNNHHWERIDSGVDLWKRISGEFKFLVEQVKENEAKLLAEERDDMAKIRYTNRIKNLDKIIGKLLNGTFKERLMKDAAYYFYDKNFLRKLDDNPYLVPFKNGIYDVSTHTFRPGKPEDYVSKTLPIDYKEFTETDERFLEVIDFFEKVFPDEELRHYVLSEQLSELFIGGNRKKLVFMWTGCGDNSKSVTQLIIEKLLGDGYAVKIPTTVMTSKKPLSGTPWPELARAGNGVRWAAFEESDKNEKINIGILKGLSGNDSIFVRDLFERGKDTREMIPMFKVVWIANKLPIIDSSDKATRNRIRVIPFESIFSKDAPEDPEEQRKTKCFPIDHDFSRKIPSLLEPMAYYLITYNKFHKKEAREPDKVLEATKHYMDDNDFISMFIEETFTRDENGIIMMEDIYRMYKLWHKDNMAGTCNNKRSITEEMVRVWGGYSVPGVYWKGWRLQTKEEENSKHMAYDKSKLVNYTNENNNHENHDNEIPM